MLAGAIKRLLRHREPSLPAFVHVGFARDYERVAGVDVDVGPLETRIRDLGESERVVFTGSTGEGAAWLDANGYRYVAPNIWCKS